MSTKKITIGIPAYNRPQYLRAALQSCLTQTYANVEILIADDASPLDLLPEVQDLQDDRWRYVRHEKNIGGPANFNFLIEQAQGDYFILHQDDDVLHPEFCARAIAAFEINPGAVFYCGRLLRGPELLGVMGQDIKPFSGPWLPLDYLNAQVYCLESLEAQLMLLFEIPFMHPAIAMNLSVLRKSGGYYEQSFFGSDNATLIQMLFHGPALYDTHLSGHFRLHGKNVSTLLRKAEEGVIRRKMANLFLPQISQRHSDWAACLKKLLLNLPRRTRWSLLVQALESGYPQALIDPVAQSLGNNQKKTLLRARWLKANWWLQWQHLTTKKTE